MSRSGTIAEAFALRDQIAEFLKGNLEDDGRISVNDSAIFYDIAEYLLLSDLFKND